MRVFDYSQDRHVAITDYHRALGKFVDEFSRVEAILPITLAAYAQVPEKRARALFSGWRIDATSGNIRRLHEVGEIPPDHWRGLEPILTQLAHLNSARNLLLHYGARDIAEGSGHASNARIAHIQSNVRTIPISPEILGDMVHDLQKISLHLVWYHVGRPKPSGKHPAVEALLASPWRYKPPQPAKKDSQNKQKGRQKKG